MTNRSRLFRHPAGMPLMALLALSGGWSAGLMQTQRPDPESLQARDSLSETIAITAPGDQQELLFSRKLRAAKPEQRHHPSEQLALVGSPIAGWLLLDTNHEA